MEIQTKMQNFKEESIFPFVHSPMFPEWTPNVAALMRRYLCH